MKALEMKLFRSLKPFLGFLVHLYLTENGEAYTPGTSCMERTSFYNKNMWIKQLCNIRFGIFLWLSGCENFSGPSRNGPQDRAGSRFLQASTEKTQ